MGFRITTSMMVNNYRYNLMNSTNNLNDSRTKVVTHRNFSSYAEDPAAATNAWRLRRAFWKNENYRASNTEALTRFQAAYSTMESIDDNLLNGSKGAFEAIKRADNDPEGGARVTLGRVLSELADSIIYSMNGAKYSDHFVFSGNDEMNAPFRWSEDGKTLYYRNVDVNAGGVKKPTVPDPWANSTSPQIPVDMPDINDPNLTLTQTEKDWIAHYQDPTNNAAPIADLPAWANSQPVPADMPKTSDDPDEQAWIDYYRGGMTGTKPTTPEPAWTATQDVVPCDMPESSSDPIEQGWIDFYSDPTGATKEPIAPEPDWGGKVPQEVYDLKNADPPFDPDDPNATTQKKAEHAWMEYYVAIAHGEEAEEPQIVADEPSWDLTSDRYGTPMKTDANGKTTFMTEADCADDMEKEWLAYYKDQAEFNKLKELSAEREIMDTGLGLQEISDRELIDTTAFNRSLPGVNMLGYGVDQDGDPKNIVMIMKRLSVIYSQCAEDGTFCDENGNPSNKPGDAVYDEVYRLLGKFGEAHDRFNRAYSSDIAAQAEFLEANGDRLEEQSYNLQEQVLDIEQVDMADAITAFMWDYNCYSAALKVGTQLLSQSLIDYMS